MNKKSDPRTKYIIVRVTPSEKQKIVEEAYELNVKDVSTYLRTKIGLKR